MNKLIIILLLFTNLHAQNETPKEEGIKYIKLLGKALKTQLKAHLKADKSGVGALNFCSDEAFKITKEVNLKLPASVKVRRTAFKVRNEKNRADNIDVKVMKSFLSHPTKLKTYQDGDTFRVYKPLYTMGVCLKCHGNNLSKELKEILKKKYPHDKAIDFMAGSLRGVIVSEIVH